MDQLQDNIAAACCPLCGQANGCALAAGSGRECWCVSAEISSSARARAAALGGEARCICPSCGAPETTTPAVGKEER